MGQKSHWTTGFVTAVLSLGVLTFIYVSLLRKWRREEDQKALSNTLALLHNIGPTRSGRGAYWTGDVAGLYKLGLISRDVAEADAAPITPLVNQPRPFHGYYFVAMESGPASQEGMDRVLLKGQKENKDVYAFCAYPAEDGYPDRPVYIVCPWGLFKRASGGSKPVLNWPKTNRELRQEWWIID